MFFLICLNIQPLRDPEWISYQTSKNEQSFDPPATK